MISLIFLGIVLLLSYSKYTSVTTAPSPMGFLAALIPILLWGSAKYAKIVAIITGIFMVFIFAYAFMGKNTAEGDVGGSQSGGWFFGLSFFVLMFGLPIFVVSVISIFVNRGIVSLINKDLLRRLNSGTKNVVAGAAAT